MSTAEAWTVGRLLTWTAEYLKKQGSSSPRLDAEVLLAEARGCQRIELYTAFTEEPSEEVRASFKEMVRRRAEGTPVAYLVGRKEFYSLAFEVNPDVLIPRPETEHLIVEAVDRAKKLTGNAENSTVDGAGEGSARPRGSRSYASLSIADIGTGSGIVAISLAKSLSGASIVAVDISPAALAVAQRNVDQHAVQSQVTLLPSDLLSGIGEATVFDMIVSNPPYISEPEYDALPVSVRNYEPRGALVGGPSGTEIIASLMTQAAARLKSGGWLLMEISPTIADQVVAQVDRSLWSEPAVTKDLAGHARIIAMSRLAT